MADQNKSSPQRQSDKFKDAAHEHGCDEDDPGWEERLKTVTKQKTEISE